MVFHLVNPDYCFMEELSNTVEEVLASPMLRTFTFRAFRHLYPKRLKRLIHTDGRVDRPAQQEQLGLNVTLRDTSTLGGAGFSN